MAMYNVGLISLIQKIVSEGHKVAVFIIDEHGSRCPANESQYNLLSELLRLDNIYYFGIRHFFEDNDDSKDLVYPFIRDILSLERKSEFYMDLTKVNRGVFSKNGIVTGIKSIVHEYNTGNAKTKDGLPPNNKEGYLSFDDRELTKIWLQYEQFDLVNYLQKIGTKYIICLGRYSKSCITETIIGTSTYLMRFAEEYIRGKVAEADDHSMCHYFGAMGNFVPITTDDITVDDSNNPHREVMLKYNGKYDEEHIVQAGLVPGVIYCKSLYDLRYTDDDYSDCMRDCELLCNLTLAERKDFLFIENGVKTFIAEATFRDVLLDNLEFRQVLADVIKIRMQDLMHKLYKEDCNWYRKFVHGYKRENILNTGELNIFIEAEAYKQFKAIYETNMIQSLCKSDDPLIVSALNKYTKKRKIFH